jgi:hypothetical protein
MPISEDRLKKRLEIRRGQASAKDNLMAKLREKIMAGYIPKDAKEFADVLRMVADHAKHVGYEEECKDILEKLSEEKPMPIEKVGVECSGDHSPAKGYMEKKASGDIQCRFCGAKFADLNVQEKTTIKDEIKQAKGDGRDAIEKMLNM